jgi:hypothetical protein
MATHTLPLFHANRDLDQAELNALEALVDGWDRGCHPRPLRNLRPQGGPHRPSLGDVGRGVGSGVHEGNRAVGDALHSETACACNHMQSLTSNHEREGTWPRLTTAYT